MYQIFQECSKHSIKCTKCTITFQTTFFLKQNYRLTIIHSQTLQLSCNSFNFSQESCYLYSIYILYRLSIQPQFSPFSYYPLGKLFILIKIIPNITKETFHGFFNIITSRNIFFRSVFFFIVTINATRTDSVATINSIT